MDWRGFAEWDPRSCEKIWGDEIENYEKALVSELEITKHPFSQGSISNFTNISIKKIKKNYNIYQIIPFKSL